jgi:hypothetical protein
MIRRLKLMTFAVVLGLSIAHVAAWSIKRADEQRLVLTRSSWGVYHDYAMPQRYFIVKTWTCTPPPAIRARAVLDIDYALRFESGEVCEVSSIIEWGPKQRWGASLAWSARDGKAELPT